MRRYCITSSKSLVFILPIIVLNDSCSPNTGSRKADIKEIRLSNTANSLKVRVGSKYYNLPILYQDSIAFFERGCCPDSLVETHMMGGGCRIEGYEYCQIVGVLRDTLGGKRCLLGCCAAALYMPMILVVDSRGRITSFEDISHGCCAHAGYMYRCSEEVLVINKIPLRVINKFQESYIPMEVLQKYSEPPEDTSGLTVTKVEEYVSTVNEKGEWVRLSEYKSVD